MREITLREGEFFISLKYYLIVVYLQEEERIDRDYPKKKSKKNIEK